MVALARRNLFHDRVRLLATLIGIVFSVVLATVQLGLFVGFTATTADVIVHAGADLWMKSQNVGSLEAAVPFPDSKRYQALGTAGVATVEKYVVQYSDWKLPNGAVENILLIGLDPDGQMGRPWNLTQGHVADLKIADTIMIDELYRTKLGITHLFQQVEIRGYRARVIGFTHGIRTFTTSPAVFTSFKNAQNYAGLRQDQTLYLLVRALPGADLQELKQRLLGQLSYTLGGVLTKTLENPQAFSR